MFKEGDIVEIPLPDGRMAIGWILHISRRFKNAVGFVVFGIKGQLRVDAVSEFRSSRPEGMKVLGPLYTHMDALKHYRWRTFAHQAVSHDKRMLTKLNVGGNVYVADDYLGPIKKVDDPTVRPMLAMGMPVIYSEIEKAFGKPTTE